MVDRTVLITGGCGEIGRATARRFAKEGYRLALLDTDPQRLQEVSADFHKCVWRAVDIRDATETRQTIDGIVEELGTLNVLVNGAGIVGPVASVEDYPIEAWNDIIQVNLVGMFHVCKAAVPHLRKAEHGRVVNLASVSGKDGNPWQSAYSASKAGVMAFTKSLAKELTDTDIRVNCITPAAINSPMIRSMGPEQIKYVVDKIPLGRTGEPDEVAAMIFWLASEECSFSTGAAFDISGGRSTY